MFLKMIADTATQLAQMIARLLSVDVMIVDSSLERISNTYRVGEALYPIKQDSNVGQVIQTGQPLIIDRAKNYPACMVCLGRSSCSVDGFIGVPIFYHDAVVGAIALIVPMICTVKIFSNTKNVVAFLEQAAALLSEVIGIADKNGPFSLDLSALCRMMPDAVAATDPSGFMTYYNSEFTQLFPDVVHSCEPRITDIPGIASIISGSSSVPNRQNFLLSTPGPDGFWGTVESITFDRNSTANTIYIFRSLQNRFSAYPQFPLGVLPAYPPIQQACQQAQKRIDDHSPLVLYGEAGSGKMLVAEALHLASPARNGGFFVFDCSVYPSVLHKSLLFGQQHNCSEGTLGLLLQANKGTFVFRNAEYLSLDVQRLMAASDFRRTSGEQFGVVGQLDIQVIYTTSSLPTQSTLWTKYAPEFVSKILTKPLEIKPLRESQKDILPLLQHFIQQYANERKCGQVELTADLIQMVQAYEWWGNLIELQKAAERIVDSVRIPTIDITDIFSPHQAAMGKAAAPIPVDREKEQILSCLRQHISKAEIAKRLGISRATLYRRLKEYHIS